MLKIPLIEDLTTEPIPPGYCILVEYDPSSQWFNTSVSIAAGWLRQGGEVVYQVATRPPETVSSQLKRLGLDSEALDAEKRFQLWDAYTVTLGLKSKEKYARESLKIADLSLTLRRVIDAPPQPHELRLADTWSVLARFNDEKVWVEFLLSRLIPSGTLRKNSTILPIARGVHTDWAYRQLEDGVDGVVDFKLKDADQARNLIRIRNMRGIHFDTIWRPLRIAENFEVMLEEQLTSSLPYRQRSPPKKSLSPC